MTNAPQTSHHPNLGKACAVRPGQRVVLIGGGGHALVVAEAIELVGAKAWACLDDAPTPWICQGAIASTPSQIQRLGTLAEVEAALSTSNSVGWILALGDLQLRNNLIRTIRESNGIETRSRSVSVIHPTAWISDSARIGAGVFVGPRAVIHSRAVVEEHCIINTGAIVEHDCQIGQNCHLAPGAVLGGGTHVGPNTLIGIGACTIPGMKIAAWSIVGAGAAVVREIPDEHTRVMGVPGRVKAKQ